MTVLIDSWAWIEYFQGTQKGRAVGKYVEGEEGIVVSAINIAEVFRYLLAKRSQKDAEAAAKYMVGLSLVIPVTTQIAIDAAKIRHERKWGLGDSIILATALHSKAVIVTGDNDFRNEKGVAFLG